MSLLLKPIEAGPLTLTNRLVMPPMATAKADAEGRVTRELLDYYGEKSQGGYISLVIVEHSYVSMEGKMSSNQLSMADNSSIHSFRELADILHRSGSKAVIQINHAGSLAKEEVTGTTPVGPSAVVNPKMDGMVPRELDREEIRGIVEKFRDAALRVKEAGFDGVEIHSAHGFLLNQFYSPLTNKRTDEYGGNVHNRIRIHLQIIEAIQSAAGEDFLILIRLGASDFAEGGTTIEDSCTAAMEFEKAGVGILDISGGITGSNVPGHTGQGYFSHLTQAIKKCVSIPVILTGGITEAQAAEQLLAEGKADLIGVGRALLKDSSWAQQAVESLRG